MEKLGSQSVIYFLKGIEDKNMIVRAHALSALINFIRACQEISINFSVFEKDSYDRFIKPYLIPIFNNCANNIQVKSKEY